MVDPLLMASNLGLNQIEQTASMNNCRVEGGTQVTGCSVGPDMRT